MTEKNETADEKLVRELRTIGINTYDAAAVQALYANLASLGNDRALRIDAAMRAVRDWVRECGGTASYFREDS